MAELRIEDNDAVREAVRERVRRGGGGCQDRRRGKLLFHRGRLVRLRIEHRP